MLKMIIALGATLMSLNVHALVCINGQCDNDPLPQDGSIISTRPLQDAAIEEALRQRQKRDLYHEQNNNSIPGMELHIDGRDFYQPIMPR